MSDNLLRAAMSVLQDTVGTVRVFATRVGAGYGLKASINLALALAFGGRNRKARLIEAFGMDALRFGLFLGGMAVLYRVVLRFLRELRQKDDRWNAFVAGFVSGIALLIDAPSRRVDLALYAFARACEVTFNGLVNKGYVRPLPYGEVLLFVLFCGIIMYLYGVEPDTLSPSYRRFLRRFVGRDQHVLDKWSALRQAIKVKEATSMIS